MSKTITNANEAVRQLEQQHNLPNGELQDIVDRVQDKVYMDCGDLKALRAIGINLEHELCVVCNVKIAQQLLNKLYHKEVGVQELIMAITAKCTALNLNEKYDE